MQIWALLKALPAQRALSSFHIQPAQLRLQQFLESQLILKVIVCTIPVLTPLVVLPFCGLTAKHQAQLYSSWAEVKINLQDAVDKGWTQDRLNSSMIALDRMGKETRKMLLYLKVVSLAYFIVIGVHQCIFIPAGLFLVKQINCQICYLERSLRNLANSHNHGDAETTASTERRLHERLAHVGFARQVVLVEMGATSCCVAALVGVAAFGRANGASRVSPQAFRNINILTVSYMTLVPVLPAAVMLVILVNRPQSRTVRCNAPVPGAQSAKSSLSLSATEEEQDWIPYTLSGFQSVAHSRQHQESKRAMPNPVASISNASGPLSRVTRKGSSKSETSSEAIRYPPVVHLQLSGGREREMESRSEIEIEEDWSPEGRSKESESWLEMSSLGTRKFIR
ncbi:hypothetical protein T439DRAFT_123274 [Meredithblackwellia eburnea MCA 4105]